MLSELFLFTPPIIIYWVYNGGVNTTLINACPWAVPVRVALSSYSALLWNGWPKLHINHIVHLLDDFLIIAASHEICLRQLNLFVDLCGHLGIPIAPEKTCGPATTLSFAGIELDTIQLEARLPSEKKFEVQRPNC